MQIYFFKLYGLLLLLSATECFKNDKCLFLMIIKYACAP